MRKLVWVVCGAFLLILVVAVPLAFWLRSRGVGLPSLRAGSRGSASRDLPKPTWKSDPAALAAAGLPDPTKATLGLAAVDADGRRVGVRSIMPWIVGEPDDDTTSAVGAVLASELDFRVGNIPQLYNTVSRDSICSFSHAADYDGEGIEAERKAALVTAQRIGHDCLLLGHLTGKPEAVTGEFVLYDVGAGEPAGESWTIAGTEEELCARDGEVLLEAMRLAQVALEPAHEQWLQQPLTANEDAFGLALRYVAAAEDSEALALARKLVKAAPDYPLAYGYLFGAERVHGSCMAAAPVMRAVVDNGAVQPRQLLSALMIAADCGEWEWTAELIKRHEAVQPKSFTRSRRAMSYWWARGRADKAIACAEELIDLNPRSAIAWWSLGASARLRASGARAGKYVQHMRPGEYSLFASEMGRAGAAMPVAAEMDPLHSAILVELIHVYRETAEREQAEAVFGYARQLYPTDPSPYGPALWLYRKGYWNQPKKLKALRDELDEFEPETAAERFALGQLLHGRNRRAALEHMREALKEAGHIYWPEAHASFAAYLARESDTAAEAEKHARIALRQRYSEPAHLALVRALTKQEKHTEAVEEAESLVERFPHEDDAHLVHAQALMNAKRYAEAAPAYERAHAVERRNVTAARQCVRAWLVIGKTERARKKLYEMEQDSLYTEGIKSVRWGNYFLGAGEYDHALEWFDRAAKETPGEPAVQMNSGYCYLCMGDYKTAREIWERHGGPYRSDPEYALGMAICDLAAGDRASAVKGYLNVKRSDPDFLDEENLRYRYWPPRCFEWLNKIKELAAQQDEQPGGQ